MKQRTLLVFLAVLGCAKPQYRSPGADVVLTVEGRVRGSPVEFDAAALRALEQRTIRGREPSSTPELTYEGASLLALVRELEPRRGVDLVVVHGRAGYVVAIPLPAVGQHRPALANRVGGQPANEAPGERGRLVLAWPNVGAPGFDDDPRTRWWWVRDVTRVELVPWSETYGRALRVPPGASDEARHGAEAFATSCIHCHQLRQAGGKRGPDLSAGIKPGGREQLVTAVRAHETRVPELKGVDLTRRLPELAAFLEAVESAGPPLPGEESPPEPALEEPEPEELPPVMPPVGPYGHAEAGRQIAQM